MISRIKGTQDLLDLTVLNFLLSIIKKHLEEYNFSEISTPILEPLELFKRSLGLETDVITKQMYTLATGPEEELIALRPEGTASVMRAFLNNHVETVPWKVFCFGPMFRHERPQKGRLREFHQVTIEIIGSRSVYQDAHFIKMLDRLFYEKLELDTYALAINFLGCRADRAQYREKLYKFLETTVAQLCPTCVIRKEKNIMRIFDCKSEICQRLYKNAPYIADNLCATCAQEWQTLKDNLEQLSVSFSYIPTLVRGLDYYSKTVFEFISPDLGAQSTFCGGGRYENLATELGATRDYPSIGAAIGIERMLLLLQHKADLVPVEKPRLHVIVPLTQEQHALALLLADELQAQGLCVDILLEGDSVKSMMRKANKMGARFVMLLGPDEQAQRTVTVKNMVSGEEHTVSQTELVNFLK